MRYTALTALVVAFTYVVCWGHWRTVDAHPAIAAPPSGEQPNPWMSHEITDDKGNVTMENKYHMCISEHKYAGLSAAIHRLEEELKIVTNLTFINAGNHTIPTTTYEGFTQQLSLIKDILKTIDDDNGPNPNPMPNFRHINFTDLLPWLPTWELTIVENATNYSKTVPESSKEFADYIEKYHHRENVFLHMLIEFLLNLQQNFENFVDYVEQLGHKSTQTVAQGEPISDELEKMELRFEHFASSILQKIGQLDQKLRSEPKERERESPVKHEPESRNWKQQNVASPVWQDHSTHNASLVGIEDKLDVLHEKFINFAKDTEERLEALESQQKEGKAPITGKQ